MIMPWELGNMLPLFNHLPTYFNIFNKEGKLELQIKITELYGQKVPSRSHGLALVFHRWELEGLNCWMTLLAGLRLVTVCYFRKLELKHRMM